MFDFESGVVDECVRIDKGITRIYYPYLIGASRCMQLLRNRRNVTVPVYQDNANYVHHWTRLVRRYSAHQNLTEFKTSLNSAFLII